MKNLNFNNNYSLISGEVDATGQAQDEPLESMLSDISSLHRDKGDMSENTTSGHTTHCHCHLRFSEENIL